MDNQIGGFHLVDIVIVIVYLLLMVVIGIMAARLIKNTADFFIGGRRFGKFLSIMLSFGAGTHSDQAVAVTELPAFHRWAVLPVGC